jgi:hypothetical protein
MGNEQSTRGYEEVANQVFIQMAFEKPGGKRAKECVGQPTTELARPVQKSRPWSGVSHGGRSNPTEHYYLPFGERDQAIPITYCWFRQKPENQ